MEVGTVLQDRIDSWDRLSQWERWELGKDVRLLALSYGVIMELIPVKKSTLATWCREVKLTEEQYVAIRTRTQVKERTVWSTGTALSSSDDPQILGTPSWSGSTHCPSSSESMPVQLHSHRAASSTG